MKSLPIFEPNDLKSGDVAVVPFPFSDKLAEKRRPAMVMSNASLSREGVVWIVMITSARQSAMVHDVPILNHSQCGL